MRRLRAAVCALVVIGTLVLASCDAQKVTSAPAPLKKPEIVGNAYKAAYHYVECESTYVVEPANTAETADAVRYFVQEAAARKMPLKIRASRRKFHSTTNFVCPFQPTNEVNGTAPNMITVGVMHSKMNKVLKVDRKNSRLTVGAGMKVSELLEAATANNMSVVAGTLPAYAGLTLGGVLASGAHGSGDNASSNICDVLLNFTMIDGKGQVHQLKRISPEGLAVCAGMGLLGIVTEMTIQLTPTTHTKLITRYLANDTNLVDDIEKMLKVSPHMLVFWRPDMKVYSAYMLKTVSASIPASDDKMWLLPSYKGMESMAELMETLQKDIYDTHFVKGWQEGFMCPVTGYNSAAHTWAATGDNKSRVLYSIAKTNRMQSSECDEHCAWNGPEYNGTAEDVHLSIEFRDFRNWVSDMRKIIQMELWEYPADRNRCLGPGYFWLRFGHNTTDHLAMSNDMERPVYVQSTWLRSRGAPEYPMRFGYVQDLLEEMTLCKYKGRPHWGKNYARTFTHEKCPIRDMFKGFDQVLALQKKYDPAKVYEPELWGRVAARKGAIYYPGCHLDKECFCKEDIHCGKGHACVPAKSFPEYKVCKPNYEAAGVRRQTAAPKPNPLLPLPTLLGH